ncbi:hypothetical protein PR048_001627 [Dryococelus australis]|uniref:MD-2-related lipid-recognition domain-containing protein n=1 Tax=Dryococelus australis TaxID=614101 RepID=A0ABQ9IHW9_9NEOP|nr:hypothetical protein PR048_001627 [Dryococelus australis]
MVTDSRGCARAIKQRGSMHLSSVETRTPSPQNPDIMFRLFATLLLVSAATATDFNKCFTSEAAGPRWCSGQTTHLPPILTELDSRWGRSQAFTCGNLARRCCWSAGFLGDLPFPTPTHLGASPYSPRFTLIESQDLDVKNCPNHSSWIQWLVVAGKSGTPPTALSVNGCAQQPCSFKPGAQVAVNVTFLVDHTVSKMTPDVKAVTLGITTDYPLPQTDGCKALIGSSCPVEDGESVVYELRINIPPINIKATWVRLSVGPLPDFRGNLPFPPHLHSGVVPYSSHFTPIGSQDLRVVNGAILKKRTHYACTNADVDLTFTMADQAEDVLTCFELNGKVV